MTAPYPFSDGVPRWLEETPWPTTDGIPVRIADKAQDDDQDDAEQVDQDATAVIDPQQMTSLVQASTVIDVPFRAHRHTVRRR